MAALEINNCDDCVINVPFDLALELTKVFYSCKVNSEREYYKSDILEVYNYFKKELGGADNEEENKEYTCCDSYDSCDNY